MKLNSCMTPLNGESCILQITDPLIGAALISGGSSLLGGFLGNSASSKEGERQRKWASAENALNRQFQHDEAELSYNRNEQTRIAQNEWNSEPAQVSRMRQAGINPYNALSGLSGSSATSAGNTASAGNAHGSSISYQQRNLDWVRAISETGLVAAQAYKTRAEAKAIEHQNNLTDSQSSYYGFLAAGQQIENGIRDKYGSLEAFARVNNLESETALNDAQRFLAKTQDKLGQFDLTNLKPAQQANYLANVFLSESQDLLNRANAAKTDQERKQIIQQMALNYALTMSAISLNNAHIADLHASSAERYANIGLMGQQKDESWSRMNLNNWQSKFNKIDWQISEHTKFQVANEIKKSLQYKIKWFDRRIADSWEGTAFNILDETKEIVNFNLGGFVGGTRNLTPTPSHTPIRGFGR